MAARQVDVRVFRADTLAVAMTGDNLCTCGHVYGWHEPIDGKHHGPCLHPTGSTTEDGCTAFAPAAVDCEKCGHPNAHHTPRCQWERDVPAANGGCTCVDESKRVAPARQVSVTDTIENVLREHQGREIIRDKQTGDSFHRCVCGGGLGLAWTTSDLTINQKYQNELDDRHRKHQAAVIAQRLEAK